KLKYNSICLVIISLLIMSCGKKEESTEKSAVKTEQNEKHNEEVAPTIAALTEEQMKSVGITLGSIEMKELTSTIKANGL
ncbi:efflux RND transporter periplasmic adaptor subunit, partial [Chryseobacterium sp. SIMBA_028]